MARFTDRTRVTGGFADARWIQHVSSQKGARPQRAPSGAYTTLPCGCVQLAGTEEVVFIHPTCAKPARMRR